MFEINYLLTDRPVKLLYACTFDFLTDNRKLNLKNVTSGNSHPTKRQNDVLKDEIDLRVFPRELIKP